MRFNTDMGAPAVTLERTLPPHASSASEARRLVLEALEQADLVELADSARVAVSEVVTNALVHAGTAMHVVVRAEEGCVRVEVSDGSPHLPVRRDYSRASGTGRGLGIVSDLVDDWGARPADDGKVVWFLLRAGARSPEAVVPAGADPADADSWPARVDVVSVELRNVPLLIHAAWQEHGAALLREFLLVSLMEGDEVAAFERHARASDAMNLLFEQVPAPDVGEDPEAIMIAATEPHVTAPVLVLSLPESSVGHFQTLDTMLEEAGAHAAAGQMLVPPTQPEIKELRRWLCREVRGQTTRSSPQPWRYSLDATPADDGYVVPASFDPAEVSSSSRALLATNQDSIFVAVSDSAADALGYRPEELLGRRVLVVVPGRYHQAHVAGTTLHLANGRSPLLNKPVIVPMVRADGTEVEVQLEVVARKLEDGSKIFVAELVTGV